MYVCLGDAVVRADEVVAVLDVRVVRASALNGPLLDRLSGGGPEDGSLPGACRTVVVTRRGVLACPLSAEAVRRRLQAVRTRAQSGGGRGRAR